MRVNTKLGSGLV